MRRGILPEIRIHATASTPYCVSSRCGQRTTRQIDRKHTSRAGQVAGINTTAIRFGPPSTKRQSDTQARAIRASLFKRSEQQILEVVTSRQATTFVLNFDQHTLGAPTDGQSDRAAERAELECVLEEIEDDRRENLLIDFHGQLGVD